MRAGRTLFFLLIASLIVSTGSAQANVTDTLVTLDKSTRVEQAWWGDPATFQMHSSIPKLVTLTDINSIKSSGAGKVNFKQVKLSPGSNNVTISLTPDGGSRGATISDSNNMVYVSSPGKPLLEDVGPTDLYLGLGLLALSIPIQTLFRFSWFRYRLKSGLTRLV